MGNNVMGIDHFLSLLERMGISSVFPLENR